MFNRQHNGVTELTGRIAIFLPTLCGGGAERVVINLLHGFVEKKIQVDLVLAKATGPYLDQVPGEVTIIDLNAGRVLKAILPLSRYLRTHKPSVLITHLAHANLVSIIAHKLSGSKSKLIITEHCDLIIFTKVGIKSKLVYLLSRYMYRYADKIVAVSKGVAEGLQNQLGINAGKITVIYNPVINENIAVKRRMAPEHPWLQDGEYPVFLAVGRLTPQKDFETLVRAFHLLRKKVHARLIILGEGESRGELEELITALGISEDIDLPGFLDNPYSFMNKAAALVLSSRWEGLPTVLIEAMGCGCPVIATDCPSGPREILEDGKFGPLVPIANPELLSLAMSEILEKTIPRDILMMRAMDFSFDKAISQYCELLSRLFSEHGPLQ